MRAGMRHARESGAYGVRVRLVNAALATLLLLALPISPVAAAQAAPQRLLLLGDSLTAGFGLPRDQAFPARLQAWLDGHGARITVIDAGVSGDTSAGGLARLDWALGTDPPRFALVEFGGNDGLRGLDPNELYANLDGMLTRLKAHDVKVLLAGIYAPRNLGRDYAREFDAVYPRLAKRHGLALYPFFLEGVAGDPALNQSDGVHPNAAGVDAIVERIGPSVLKLVNGAPPL